MSTFTTPPTTSQVPAEHVTAMVAHVYDPAAMEHAQVPADVTTEHAVSVFPIRSPRSNQASSLVPLPTRPPWFEP